MSSILTVIHVLAAISLILVVLLQTGKGAGMGAAFGGSSETFFGSRGPTSFLSKLTTGAAICFMLTSLLLTYLSSRSATTSIVPAAPLRQGTSAPAAQKPGPAPQEKPAKSTP